MSFVVDNTQSKRDLTAIRVRLVQIGAFGDTQAPKTFLKERIYGQQSVPGVAKLSQATRSAQLRIPEFVKDEGFTDVSCTVASVEVKIAYKIEVIVSYDAWSGKSDRKLVFPIVVHEGNWDTCRNIYIPRNYQALIQAEQERRVAATVASGVPIASADAPMNN